MLIQTSHNIYKRNERLMIPAMLVIGVIVDFFTFRSVNIETVFVLLFLYWLLAGTSIAFLHHKRSHQNSIHNKYYLILVTLAPFIIQFTFGALLSSSLIFYWFSGALSISWPIICFVAFLMIANEAFREQYMRPVVQLSVYYFATFSLFSLMLPFIFNSISAWIFILAGFLSVTIMSTYVFFVLYRYTHIQERKRRIIIATLSTLILMNILYFTNLIPPIPLSLLDAGVYHSVVRIGNMYFVQEETNSLIERLIPGQTTHIMLDDSLSVFTSIFAPFDLNTPIIHEWQYFDIGKKKWITVDELSFNIYGGRESGYRGYSTKSNLFKGLWRVNVQTVRGQVIGRLRFHIRIVDKEPNTVEIQK